MSALATVARKSFNGKFTAKIDFLIGAFYVTIADADIGNLKSLHTLFEPHAGKIWTKSYGPNYTKFGAFWQKMVNNFWQSVDAILEDVSVTETVVWAKILIQRLLSFSVPKITALQHV